MPCHGISRVVVAVVLLATSAAVATEAPDPSHASRLQVTLGSVLVPQGELVGWALDVDGEPVAAPTRAEASRAWEGTLAPGPHVLSVRALYRRELKTLVDHPRGHILGFTFVGAGSRWLDQRHLITLPAGALVHLQATICDDPGAVDDRLELTSTVLVAGASSGGPVRSIVASERLPTTDPAALARERATWVAALVSPALTEKAGSGGDVHVRFSVDASGYLRATHLDRSSGVPLLDSSIEDVLRLAEPYPVFAGDTELTLSFGPRDELPPFPLWKTDPPVVRPPQVVIAMDEVKIRFRGATAQR